MGISIQKIALAFVFCFSSFVAVTAQPTVKTTVDKKDILIGQQVNLQVVANMPRQDFFVKWLIIPETLPHFDLVEKTKIDSVFDNQKLVQLSQTFTFTSFDSGKWTLPAFEIHFNPSTGGDPFNFLTDTFSIAVSYQADSTTVLKDIKDIREAATLSTLQFWLILIIGTIVMALLGWLIYGLVKKNQKKSIVAQSSLSPYQYAMTALDTLRQLNLADPAEVKKFHTRLTEILKTYLSSIHGAYLISSTTAEVVILLNEKSLDRNVISKTAETLRRSDAAKFAKFIPLQEENEQSWLTVKQVIELTEQLQNKNKNVSDT
jgi:uncharacterized membrane-anchored protein YhcB (DUF1043 family)